MRSDVVGEKSDCSGRHSRILILVWQVWARQEERAKKQGRTAQTGRCLRGSSDAGHKQSADRDSAVRNQAWLRFPSHRVL